MGKRQSASGRVYCICCNKLVSPNTRRNHLKGKHGGPAVQAAALTYRRQVMAAGPSSATDGPQDADEDLSSDDDAQPGPSGLHREEAHAYEEPEG